MTKTKSMAERLKDSVLGVTKDWAKQRKAEERHASALANRRARLIRARDYYNFKSAAEEVMERAYMAASANGTLPASARQVMYRARPFIQEMMGGQQLNDQYFCQQLLPNYIEEYGVDWDVVYDDRGHFIEPHTGHTIGLGTISVREYLDDVAEPKMTDPGFAPGTVVTHGPDGCFGAVLFIEKEGFLPLFEAVHLAQRYDIAIMSTKGMAVTAARTLIDRLCKHELPLLALHDLDKAGLSIAGTLRRNTRRFTFSRKNKIVDLGLRLADVRELGLEASAEDAFDRGRDFVKRQNLLLNGATTEEAGFLLRKRVELNAMTSDQLVAFIERKLQQHGVKKIMPNSDLLGETYRLVMRKRKIEEIIERELQELDGDSVEPPPDLDTQVRQYLEKHPQARWDEAVSKIADAPEAFNNTQKCPVGAAATAG
jgi:hypothetical protein